VSNALYGYNEWSQNLGSFGSVFLQKTQQPFYIHDGEKPLYYKRQAG